MQFDITFPAVSCTLLSLDAIDISGEQHLDIVCLLKIVFKLLTFLTSTYYYSFLQKHAVMKNRIDANGNVIQVRMDDIGTPKLGKPIQKHGGEIEHNETYCGSCYGAQMVRILSCITR